MQAPIAPVRLGFFVLGLRERATDSTRPAKFLHLYWDLRLEERHTVAVEGSSAQVILPYFLHVFLRDKVAVGVAFALCPLIDSG